MNRKALKSMTGYAVVEKQHGDRKFKLHLKTVNHRFTELKCRMPRAWMAFETDARQVLQKILERGSFDFWVEESSAVSRGEQTTRVKDAFTKLNAAMGEVDGISQLSLPNPIRAMILARFPDLWLHTEEPEDKSSVASSDFLSWLNELAHLVDQTRAKEGLLIRETLLAYADDMAERRKRIEEQYPTLRADWERGYKERIQKAAEDLKVAAIPEERLLQELLVLGEKRDVAEELQRASGHIENLRSFLQNPNGDNTGKKIEFLLQELHREWTTLGNKIQNLEVAKSVVEAKLSLEKIREQSLNLV